MSSEQKGFNPKTPRTGMSGRESLFDRRLLEYRNTGNLSKPTTKTRQFFQSPNAEFETPSMDSKLHAQKAENDDTSEIERLAFIDENTGLLNARTIMGKIAIEMRRSARYKHNFSIFIIEMDNFDLIESRSPLTVEMIFASFCRIVSRNIREVDILGRFDKSALLVVCPEASLSEAAIEAERLRSVIAQTHFKQAGHYDAMTVSIGIASFPQHGNAPIEMLGAAMEAAQQSVAAGGNTVYAPGSGPIKIGGMSFPEEDFSPTSQTQTQDLVKPEEDMSPPQNDITGTDLAFPSTDISTFIK